MTSLCGLSDFMALKVSQVHQKMTDKSIPIVVVDVIANIKIVAVVFVIVIVVIDIIVICRFPLICFLSPTFTNFNTVESTNALRGGIGGGGALKKKKKKSLPSRTVECFPTA